MTNFMANYQEDLQRDRLLLFMSLTSDHNPIIIPIPLSPAGVTQQLVDAGGIDVLLTVMDLAPQSAGLQEAATYALCNICATPGTWVCTCLCVCFCVWPQNYYASC